MASFCRGFKKKKNFCFYSKILFFFFFYQIFQFSYEFILFYCVAFLKIPSSLERFVNTNTTTENNSCGNKIYSFNGYITLSDEDRICPICNHQMQKNHKLNVRIKHIPFGGIYTQASLERVQMLCPYCGCTKMQGIPFKDENHFVTKELRTYIEDLLKTNKFTNKDIATITGVNRNIIKEIDKERLMKKYTVDGLGKELFKPEQQARYLCIDEFKLHDGYKFATHIIDYETGHILWIAEGKKKQVVYDFIEHVGLEWMSKVIAVACDMNSDFEEAFKDRCPHIQIVYDYFHIVKNFNDKVVSGIRKDEQKRLLDIGDEEAARKLKRSRFILFSSEDTLKKKDQEVAEEKVISKESDLFNKQEVKRKGNYYDRYSKLVNENELFLIIELIKEALSEAYHTDDEDEMVQLIFDIMELCEASGNKNLLWFENLLYNHFDGIISHATYKISSGKIEGINNKIKTLRRQAYGYPDDEYFFLKLFDMSRC